MMKTDLGAGFLASLLSCAAALAAVGCGSGEMPFGAAPVASSSTASTGGAGGGGDGGSGGEAVAGVGGAGGEPESNGGTGGDGGDGGSVAECPAAPCVVPGFQAYKFGCDAAACGAAESWCDTGACVPGPFVASIGYDDFQVRVPPMTEAHPNCKSNCSPTEAWWSVQFKLPHPPLCVRAQGPENGRIVAGSYDVDYCGATFAGESCTTQSVESTASAEVYLRLMLLDPAFSAEPPDNGAVFTISVTEGACVGEPLECDGGCNGAGDAPL